jgi:hypothetical protein
MGKKHVKIWNQKQKRLHNNSIHFSERGFIMNSLKNPLKQMNSELSTYNRK